MWVYDWHIFWFVSKYLLQRDRKQKCSVNLFLSLKNTPTFFTLPDNVPDELLFSIHASGSLAIYFLSTCVPISTWQSEPIAEYLYFHMQTFSWLLSSQMDIAVVLGVWTGCILCNLRSRLWSYPVFLRLSKDRFSFPLKHIKDDEHISQRHRRIKRH